MPEQSTHSDPWGSLLPLRALPVVAFVAWRFSQRSSKQFCREICCYFGSRATCHHYRQLALRPNAENWSVRHAMSQDLAEDVLSFGRIYSAIHVHRPRPKAAATELSISNAPNLPHLPSLKRPKSLLLLRIGKAAPSLSVKRFPRV